MGSFVANFITIVLLAIVTFVVLDVNKNDLFEKTTTAKYLNKIGATPYVNKGLSTIQQSTVYREYVLPNWNAVVSFVRPHTITARNAIVKYSNVVVAEVQKKSVTVVDYVDGTLFPTVKEYSSRSWVAVQGYYNRVYAVTSEYTLTTTNWLNKNLFSKYPHEIQKAFVNFVASTQKAAINSYEWASGQIQKLVA